MTPTDTALPAHLKARIIAPRPDCWIWSGAIDRGYGRVWVDGVARRVHRVVYEALAGSIPEGMELDHLCRVKACCNPDHLEVVSLTEHRQRTAAQQADVRRAAGGPIKRRAALGSHCANGHEFTPDNTYLIPGGGRRCRTCARASEERRKQRGRRRVRRNE